MVVPQYAYTEREIVLARWFFPISFVRIAANIAFASAVKCFNHAVQKKTDYVLFKTNAHTNATHTVRSYVIDTNTRLLRM